MLDQQATTDRQDTSRTRSAVARKRRPRRTHRRSRPNIPGELGGLFWLVLSVVPVYWLVITSLSDQSEFLTGNPWVPPNDPTLDNFRLVLENGFARYLVNSLLVTAAAVALTVTASLMAAYAIVRAAGRFIHTVSTLFLLGLAIPLQATIIPVYFIVTRLHLYDTLTALVLPSVAFGIPITVLILTNFLRDVPAELFDSMRVDGASEWQLLWRLAAPLSKPALITVGIYNAIQVWNGFLFPLILTQSPEARVLPLALWSFQGEFTINVPAVLAAVVLSTLPVLALYIGGRRQLISGLTAGFGR